MKTTQKFVAIAVSVVLLVAASEDLEAADISIAGSRLTITDKLAASGKATLKFTAKDSAAGITKGSGTDLDAIEVTFTYGYSNRAGSYVVPTGALDDSKSGWRANSATLAKYVNKNAKLGTPTGAASVQIKESKQLRLTAKSASDIPFSLVDAGPPSGPITVVFSVTNADETIHYCTSFAPANVTFKEIAGDTSRKLVAKNGTAAPCPASLGSLGLRPTPRLPSPPSAPYLYFDGGDPLVVAGLVDRIFDAETSGFFSSFRSYVDSTLGGLATANDDTRARVAKAAGLLDVLGETPPMASGFTTYRDVATTAFDGLMDRTPLDSVDKFLNPPANLLNILQDSGRLQSIAEAYDFLRGSGVAPATDETIRALIATWADSFRLDWNLLGDPFGAFEGHRDNWGVKAGSALVTAALALPDHPGAARWLANGVVFLNESLGRVVADPGWYAESPHYVNYSFNNLASTAWHVKNAAGVDWFDDLAPLVDVALATRQPDGHAAPFEEGIANAFPHNVLAAAYPTRASKMLWAWENSSKDPVNYDNQQIHSVTRFLTVDTETAPIPPSDVPTQFLTGNANIAVLRSSWNSSATQLTMIAALDHSDSEAFTSRHNTENPMDVVLHAAGATLLPTSSGGPTVTSSANRAYYLEPSSKNVPLIDGQAPYVTDSTAILFSDRVDSRDASGHAHSFADMATTSVSAYPLSSTVRRTVALIDESYGVVADYLVSAVAADHGTTWRGRGEVTVRATSTDHYGADYAWPNSGSPTAHLAVDVTASSMLTGSLVPGFYAPAWGVEETLDPVRAATNGTESVLLSVLRPRLDGGTATTVAVHTAAGTPAFTVSDGTFTDVIVAGTGNDSHSLAGITTDAQLAVVRHVAASTSRVAMSSGSVVDTEVFGGIVLSSNPATLVVTIEPGVIVATIAEDTVEPLTLTFQSFAGIDSGLAHSATFDEAPLVGLDFQQAGDTFTAVVPGGGVLVIEEIGGGGP